MQRKGPSEAYLCQFSNIAYSGKIAVTISDTMDITSLFKACVKTVRTKHKALGIGLDRSGIFPRRNDNNNNKSVFLTRLRELVGQITRLRLLLLKHRKAYLNFSSQLYDLPLMTDEERDELELGAERIIGSTSNLLCRSKRDLAMSCGPPQVMEHHRNALELTRSYLKDVCEIYTELKLMRMRRTMEFKKLSRLEGEGANINIPALNVLAEPETPDVPLVPDTMDHTASSDESFEIQDVELSVQELQLFQQENIELYNELNSLAEEIQKIQSEVVSIAELQEVFTEKVLQQEQEIERISTTIVGATENVKEGNEELHLLMQRNAGLRAWALFFFITLSFSLLFLHWYND